MSPTTIGRILGLCVALAMFAIGAEPVRGQCSGTVLTGTGSFTFSTQLIQFDFFPTGLPVPANNPILADQWKVAPWGVRIFDSSPASGASAYSSTLGVAAHSFPRAVADSEGAAPGGFVEFHFVVPDSNTPTAYQEVGLWVQSGDDVDTVRFYDCAGTLICTQTPATAGDVFVGLRYTPGISKVQVSSNNFYLCDDLQFGGNVQCGGANQPPVITEGVSVGLNVQKNSTCGAPNQVTLNATDPNDPPANLTWSIATPPATGTASFPSGTTGGSTTVCYTPNPNQCASDSFVVRVRDPGLLEDTIIVNVTVANAAPVITEGTSVSKTVVQSTNCPYAPNNIPLNATDSNDPPANLTWSVSTPPLNGTASFPGGNTGGSVNVCYDPNGSQTANDSFVVRVADQCGAEDFITVNTSVLVCNPAEKANVNLDATLDGSDISAFVSVLLNPGAALPEQLCRADVGSQVDQCVSDAVVDLFDVPGFVLLLLHGNCNAPPIIDQGDAPFPLVVPPDSGCGNPGNNTNLSATDPDGPSASLSWSISANPTNGSMSFAGGVTTGGAVTVCYTPNPGQCAPDTFTVRVADAQNAADTITANVTISNNPPDITQGSSTNMSVVHNSSGCGAPSQITLSATDPGGNASALSWSIQSQPGLGTASIVGPSVGAGVNVCYTPATNQCTPSSFVVRVQDPCLAADTITVNTSITNTAPDITQGASVNLNVLHNSSCGPANQITLNGTDPDGNASLLLWTISSQPPTGQGTASIVGSATGASVVICYAPATDQCGPSSFVVRVQDDCGAFDTITVNTAITNQPPVIAEGDSLPLVVQPDSICNSNQVPLSASHPDGSPALLNWSISTPPSLGSASFIGGTNGGNVTVCYAPASGQTQPTSFAVRVTDNCGGQDTITINVTVASNNQPPVITQGMATNLSVPKNSICFDSLNEITLNATDDGPLAQLTWSIDPPAPASGIVSINGSNTGGSAIFCYEPDPEQAAGDSFVVRVQDAQNDFDTIIVNVSVQNDPPVIDQGDGPLGQVVQMNSNCTNPLNIIELSANDPDGIDASMVWSFMNPLPANGSVSFDGGGSTGSLVHVCYVPNSAQSQPDEYTVQVLDSCGGMDLITVQVTVTP